jgi:cytochrome P450 family 138
LRDYVISPSRTRDERWSSHGVAVAPSRGARVRVQPRETIPAADTESA